MPVFAGIKDGRVVTLAECATLPAAKRCACLRDKQQIVQLPENTRGWSIPSATNHLQGQAQPPQSAEAPDEPLHHHQPR